MKKWSVETALEPYKFINYSAIEFYSKGFQWQMLYHKK